MRTAIDEMTRRRPGWRPGRAIRLMDGQKWTFPLPRATTATVALPGGPVVVPVLELEGVPDFDARFTAAGRRFHAADDDPTRLQVLMELSVLMLGANYDLTASEAVGLLMPADGDDGDATEAAAAIGRELLAIALSRPMAAIERVSRSLPYEDVESYRSFVPASN